MHIKASSEWEEHSHLLQCPCACGNEMHFAGARIEQWAQEAVIELAEAKCGHCGHVRKMRFDLTEYFRNADFGSMFPKTAWPPSSGSLYPMAEQKMPSFNNETQALHTFSIIGQWQIIGKRSGSMGSVYFCQEKREPHRFAVCKYPLNIGEEESHQRECELYQALTWGTSQRSPHVLDAVDIQGSLTGMPLLVLRAVPTGPKGAITLADWLDRKWVTPELAQAWTAHIALGLSHCRSIVKGFVHADLKPDNLLIDIGWICLLSDFGLSGNAESPARSGAPLYRAPEVWDGAQCTGASDIYSLGCIAYEMFTGRFPYPVRTDDEDSVAHAHRSIAAMADSRVPDIILACLEKLPERRPALGDIIAAFPHPSNRSGMVVSEHTLIDRINLASAKIGMGDPATAVAILKPLIAQNHPGVFTNLATALSQLGQYKAADVAYARVAETCSLDANTNYAAHLMRCERFTEAANVAAAATIQDPSAIGARITASAALNELGRFGEALTHLEAAITVDPANPDVLYQLVFTYLQLTRYSAAKNTLKKFIGLVGTNDHTRGLALTGYTMCPRLFESFLR
jgi:tetratricopeptide (TPR) repeat protein